MPVDGTSDGVTEPERAEEGTRTSAATVAQVRGQSRLVSATAVAPIKILNPSDCEPACHVVLSNYGGGLVQGDDVAIEIHCREQTELHLGSQANSRVYRCDADRAGCRQAIRGQVDGGARVVVAPEPLVLHAGSRFEQSQEWRLDEQARWLQAELIVPGRMGSGEAFAFERFCSRLRLWRGDDLLLRDDYVVEPGRWPVASPGSFGPFAVMANFYVVASEAGELMSRLSDGMKNGGLALSEEAGRPPPLLSLTPLESVGCILRALLHTAGQALELRDVVAAAARDVGMVARWPRRLP